MYLIHNYIKYNIAHYNDEINIDIRVDDYDEIFCVLEGDDNIYKSINMGDKHCDITIAYYAGIIDNVIKILDDEIFIPIKKFISDELYYYHLDELPVVFSLELLSNISSISEEHTAKITLYALINKNDVNTIDLLYDGVKQYTFGDDVFIVADIYGENLNNLNREIASIDCDDRYFDIYVFCYVEKN